MLLQLKATGDDLYSKVFLHLDLIEVDYFGLQYLDAANLTVSFLI